MLDTLYSFTVESAMLYMFYKLCYIILYPKQKFKWAEQQFYVCYAFMQIYSPSSGKRQREMTE